MDKAAKCSKHDNCKLIGSSHVITVMSEITTFDLKKGTIERRNMLASNEPTDE